MRCEGSKSGQTQSTLSKRSREKNHKNKSKPESFLPERESFLGLSPTQPWLWVWPGCLPPVHPALCLRPSLEQSMVDS